MGGITFGLAIRYLGIALGYAIALGLCAFFGTLVPPVYHGQIMTLFHQDSGRIILLGVLVCLFGVAVNGAAGYSKAVSYTHLDVYKRQLLRRTLGSESRLRAADSTALAAARIPRATAIPAQSGSLSCT